MNSSCWVKNRILIIKKVLILVVLIITNEAVSAFSGMYTSKSFLIRNWKGSLQTEEVVFPSTDEIVPMDGATVPMEGEIPPMEGATIPMEGATIPMEGATIPMEGEIPPMECETIPMEGEEQTEHNEELMDFSSASISSEEIVPVEEE